MTQNTPPQDILSIEGTPEERLKDTFTSPYPVDDEDTEWHALIVALANQFEELEATKDDVVQTRSVDDATGKQLDKLASLFQLERRTGEPDSTFRLRLKLELRSPAAAGTYDDVLNIVSLLVDTEATNVELRERYVTAPVVTVFIPTDDVGEIQVPGGVLKDAIDKVTAAGVGSKVALISSAITYDILVKPTINKIGSSSDSVVYDIVVKPTINNKIGSSTDAVVPVTNAQSTIQTGIGAGLSSLELQDLSTNVPYEDTDSWFSNDAFAVAQNEIESQFDVTPDQFSLRRTDGVREYLLQLQAKDAPDGNLSEILSDISDTASGGSITFIVSLQSTVSLDIGVENTAQTTISDAGLSSTTLTDLSNPTEIWLH